MASCKECIFYRHNTFHEQAFEQCTNEYEEAYTFEHWETKSINDEGAENCYGFCSTPEEAENKYGD